MTPISTQDFIIKFSHVNFLLLAKREKNKRVHERLLGLHHLCKGKNRIEASAIVGRTDEWLRKWVLRYDQNGYEGLVSKKQPGAKKYLTPEQEKELVVKILELQDERNGGRITGVEIAEFIEKEYSVIYKGTSIYDLLERIGMTWVSSRSIHPKTDLKLQDDFKKTFKARATKIKNKKKAYRDLVPR